MWGKLEGALDFGAATGFPLEEGPRGSRYLGAWPTVVSAHNMMLTDGRMTLASGSGTPLAQLMSKVAESGAIAAASRESS